MSVDTNIRYGSIIHLKNGNDSYLDARGRLEDYKIINHFQDPQIRGLVSTHSSKNRSMGSGSWEILSAQGLPIGEPVKYGEKILLRNLALGDEGLDTFEWVENINDFEGIFKEKGKFIGVFTSDLKRGGDGWTIEPINPQKVGSEILNNQTFRLKQIWNGTRYLFASHKVADIKALEDLDGQKNLVFIGPEAPKDDLNSRWSASLVESPRTLYYLWGQVNGEWEDFGVLQYGGLSRQPIVKLDLEFDKKNESFDGEVSFQFVGPIEVDGNKEGEEFSVTYKLNPRFIGGDERLRRFPTQNWKFSTYAGKKIDSISVESSDGGQTLRGKFVMKGKLRKPITYSLKGLRASQNLIYAKQRTMLDKIFSNDLWDSRVKRVSNVIKLIGDELKDSLETVKLGDKLKKDSDSYYLKSGFELPANLVANTEVVEAEYQLIQLLNLHTFWLSMDEFWSKLKTVFVESVKAQKDNEFHPPVHRIRRTMQRLTVDFEILQSAIQQRRSIGRPNGNYFQANSLLVTDKLAALSIAPCQRLISNSLESVVPITYFSKKIHIRQLPYSDRFVLVGLTYDLVSYQQDDINSVVPFELMAIPHEVGHFMYKHANLTIPADLIDETSKELQDAFARNVVRYEKVTFADLSEMFRDLAYYPWLEEIFADLYGCFIAGPLSVIGFQAILATEDSKRVLMDDEDHPTPIFRPYIQSEMLRVLHEINPEAYPFLDIAKSLDANWTAIIERLGFVPEDIQHGRPTRIVVPDETGSHFEDLINVNTLVEKSRVILRIFLNVLFHNIEAAIGKDPMELPWCTKLDSIEKYLDRLSELVTVWPLETADAQDNLVKAHELNPAMILKINEILEESKESLFDEWHDSGPSGFGQGGH